MITKVRFINNILFLYSKIASSDFDFGGGKQQAYSLTAYYTLLYDCFKMILDKGHKS